MEGMNESLADRLNREPDGERSIFKPEEESNENIKVNKSASNSNEPEVNSDVNIPEENVGSENSKSFCNDKDEKQNYDNIDVTLKNETELLAKMTDTFTDFSKSAGVKGGDSDNVTAEERTEIQEDGDSCTNKHNSGIEECQTKNDNSTERKEDNPSSEDGFSCNIDNLGAEVNQTKGDNSADCKGDNEDEFVDLSEESGSDADYESAEEGEEIQVDKENLQELENALTDEEKEERRNSAQRLKEEGNDLFRSGSYKSAIRIYSRALRTCPLKYAKDRAIMYSNRGACKMRLEDFEESIRDCSKALDLHPQYMKALMRRAELYEKTDKLDEALADYQKILELDPSQHTARAACLKLPDQIKERNEKLKEEMMGKLKDLGNLVLRPFGLSTNNFQMNQDPATGGYSVNFVQNPEQK